MSQISFEEMMKQFPSYEKKVKKEQKIKSHIIKDKNKQIRINKLKLKYPEVNYDNLIEQRETMDSSIHFLDKTTKKIYSYCYNEDDDDMEWIFNKNCFDLKYMFNIPNKNDYTNDYKIKNDMMDSFHKRFPNVNYEELIVENYRCGVDLEDTYFHLFDAKNNKMYAHNYLTNEWDEFSEKHMKDSLKSGLFKYKIDDSHINFILKFPKVNYNNLIEQRDDISTDDGCTYYFDKINNKMYAHCDDYSDADSDDELEEWEECSEKITNQLLGWGFFEDLL